jgi:hypothetical protein
MRRTRIRSIIISLVIIILSASNFYKAGGTENIKAVQIVSLLICGMTISIFLMNLLDGSGQEKINFQTLIN